MLEKVFELAARFTSEPQGSSDYDKDPLFVMGSSSQEYAPFGYLCKNIEGLESAEQLKELGLIYSSYSFLEDEDFEKWWEEKFSKKLTSRFSKQIALMHQPDHRSIFDAVEGINKYYQELRKHMILINGKNLPVQLGEWYAKVVFGLKQIKSTSQRGFDFYLADKKVEVKVHWADIPSPKGAKVKKSLVSLSDYVIVMYISRNFMIRDVCVLDSDFVERKHVGKGHTVFLKDTDVSQYFFSKSDKHLDKVINQSALMKFATPQLAMKLDGRF